MQKTLVKKKIKLKEIDRLKFLLSGLGLHTICSEAVCPNMSDCFSRFRLTFLILGDICTRGCRFCSVKKGCPKEPDAGQFSRIKEAARRLKLKHVVITSPTRDDLPDGGADFFYQAIKKVREVKSVESVEVLIPDFQGDLESLKKVIKAWPDILGHNLETVSRLYQIRRGAEYFRSLSLLKATKKINSRIKTKSALLLGLGEKRSEVLGAIKDLAEAGCSYLALGQYLAPDKESFPVKRIVGEKEFRSYKETAYSLGFNHVEAGTYVRSSYRTDKYLPVK